MYGDHSDACYIWNFNPAFGEADAFLLSASEPVGIPVRTSVDGKSSYRFGVSIPTGFFLPAERNHRDSCHCRDYCHKDL